MCLFDQPGVIKGLQEGFDFRLRFTQSKRNVGGVGKGSVVRLRQAQEVDPALEGLAVKPLDLGVVECLRIKSEPHLTSPQRARLKGIGLGAPRTDPVPGMFRLEQFPAAQRPEALSFCASGKTLGGAPEH